MSGLISAFYKQGKSLISSRGATRARASTQLRNQTQMRIARPTTSAALNRMQFARQVRSFSGAPAPPAAFNYELMFQDEHYASTTVYDRDDALSDLLQLVPVKAPGGIVDHVYVPPEVLSAVSEQ